MLPKTKRLNLKKDFKWVSSGKRIETPSFKFFIKTGSNTAPLVGISLAKKSFKGAVERNRARRVSSAQIEKVYDSLPKNVNLIIMPKAQILNAKEDDLVIEIKNVISNSFSN